ncbi:MAG: aminotransferase class III-fold pyridoxal phosphate-dependent enzyme, partial [Alphaproteobacteria bacterium]|nr:aminotransferase class III-fold pyridoxal phosphate-dependent enzyme [Alphaproteobacteria bacterium]
PKGFLERLRQICTKHGILLIFDEVICGFGRLGTAFGSQAFGVTPDLMTMAKAITNGVIPMGAVAVTDDVYQTIVGAGPEQGVEFFHGYTYSAHPVACVAGLATLDIYEKDGLFERAAQLSPYFLDQLWTLKGHPLVTDLRGYGLLGAFDVKPDNKPGTRGYELLQDFFKTGLMMRITGDSVLLAPAFVCERSHIDEMFDKIRRVLDRHAQKGLRVVS